MSISHGMFSVASKVVFSKHICKYFVIIKARLLLQLCLLLLNDSLQTHPKCPI